MYIVYAIQNDQNRLYIGHTNDLQDRLKRHNENREKSTKHHGPWHIVHQEEHTTRANAMKKEKYFKQGSGNRYLKEVLLNRQGV